jgi:hypothetical protein
MARKTFFSFHYERDAWRAGQVRNSNVIPNEDEYGFIDAVDWESIRRQGDDAIKRWIKDQLKDTSATAVLVGSETAERPWVQHEILESWNRGNGLVGVWIHGIKDQDRKTDKPGRNPFEQFELSDGTLLSSVCKMYDWVDADGRNNFGKWVDEAVEIRSKRGADSKISLISEQRRIALKASSSSFAPRSPWSAVARGRR